MFSARVEGGGDAAAVGRDALAALALITLALTGLAMVFMPALVWATAGGYGPERFELTVGYGRIVFPYIFFMSLSALFSGVLNATGRFAAAAAAPVLLNVFVITAMALAWAVEGPVITWLVWTVPLAGMAQLALTWSAAAQAGYPLRLGLPNWSPEMGQLLRTAIPAALATGVMQINLVVGQLVASQYDNAVSWLFAADRLYQLPLGVVGIAVGIVLLPDLTRRLTAGDRVGAQEAYSRASEFSMALTLPSAVALMVIPLPLVSVLFERGAFTSDDTAATALAVAIYGLGLPAFVLQKTLQPLFFAREDTKRPFYYALIAMVLNAALAIGLSPIIGFTAAAIGTSLTGWAMVALLWRGSRNMGNAARLDARFRTRVGRIILASVAVGLVLAVTATVMTPFFGITTIRYGALLCLIITGMISYFGIGHLIGAFKLSEFKRNLRRQDR